MNIYTQVGERSTRLNRTSLAIARAWSSSGLKHTAFWHVLALVVMRYFLLSVRQVKPTPSLYSSCIQWFWYGLCMHCTVFTKPRLTVVASLWISASSPGSAHTEFRVTMRVQWFTQGQRLSQASLKRRVNQDEVFTVEYYFFFLNH